MLCADFNLSDGWIYTEIHLNFTKWCQIGVHDLKIRKIGDLLQGTSVFVGSNNYKKTRNVETTQHIIQRVFVDV